MIGALRVATTGLVLVAGASYLMVENVTLRSRVSGLEAQRTDSGARAEALRRQLDEERGRDIHPVPSSAPVASLVLLPGLSRAETRLQELELNSSMQVARIEIEVEARDDFPRFRAELRKRTGEEVLTRSQLHRRVEGGRYVVSFDVPAEALAAGTYELTLKGVANDHTAEDVGYYYFAVVRKS